MATDQEILTRLEVAKEAALKAGEVVTKYFFDPPKREWKEDVTPVTVADTEADSIIIGHIKKHFPEDALLTEEHGAFEGSSGFAWAVDPIDGTANFSNGVPIFATSIALIKDNQPVVGVIYNGVMQALFYAHRGGGAFLNGKSLKISSDDPEHATVTFGYGKSGKDFVEKLIPRVRGKIKSKRILGSAALELAFVARGGTEGFFSLGLSIWDYAAGVLLVTEAGGRIVNLNGGPWTFEETSFLASSSGMVEKKLLEAVKDAREQ